MLLFFFFYNICCILQSVFSVKLFLNQFLVTFALCGAHSFSSLGLQLVAEGQGTAESSALLWEVFTPVQKSVA